MLKEFIPVSNSDTPWLCYRDPNSKLVYFVHSKCACTFYKKLFRKLGWTLSTTLDIDWDSDIVFSYIRHPLKKHRIGIIEWFYYNKKTDLLKANQDNDDFFTMLSCIGYIDHHSLSIHEHLGDRCRSIKWIPIDVASIDHKKCTIELIEQESTISGNIKDWFMKLPPQYVSSGFKKDCYNKLMRLPVHPMIVKSIEYDTCLYDSIVTLPGFEPDNYQNRVKQLERAGNNNYQAQQIADNEVKNGEYLQWIN